MTIQTIDIQEAKNSFASLLSLVAAGTEIILTDEQKPVIRLAPVVEEAPRVAGLHAGAMVMSEDFDAPLPDDFWLGEL